MFQLTRSELESFAGQSGFLKNSLEKMLRLIDILSILKKNPVTKDAFVLKGGTALNLFILDFPRIPIDVDLNYIGSISKAVMLRDRKSIIIEIQELFHSDYEIEIAKDVHALTQINFKYKTVSGSIDMLRLEIHYLKRVPILNPQLLNFNHCNIRIEFICLDFLELFASKIIALLSRYTPRDLFDVYQMSIYPFNANITLLRSLVFFYGIITDIKIFELFRLKFELITQSDIKNKLLPMLRRGTYPVRDEMVVQLEKFLSPFTSLTREEYEVLDNFYNSGNLDFNVLIPQKEIQKQIKISPSLKWKIHTIKKNL